MLGEARAPPTTTVLMIVGACDVDNSFPLKHSGKYDSGSRHGIADARADGEAPTANIADPTRHSKHMMLLQACLTL